MKLEFAKALRLMAGMFLFAVSSGNAFGQWFVDLDNASGLEDGTSWTTRDENTSDDFGQFVWYEVFIVLKGADIEVWRRGEHESDISLILSYSGVALDTTDRRFFRTNPGADWWIDDIGWNVRNFDYFLHLSRPALDTDPTPIDMGDPKKGIGNLANEEPFERDFDDVIRPYDVPGVGQDEGDLNDPKSFDMGAKEYPLPAASLFWWANPLFWLVVEE